MLNVLITVDMASRMSINNGWVMSGDHVRSLVRSFVRSLVGPSVPCVVVVGVVVAVADQGGERRE